MWKLQKNAWKNIGNHKKEELKYTLMPVPEEWNPIIKEARLLNKPVTSIIETWHKGRLFDAPFQGLTIDQPNVMLSALKYSEDNIGVILRVYETDGKECDFQAYGDVFPAKLCSRITPWSVKTYYLEQGSDEWKEELLTEYKDE